MLACQIFMAISLSFSTLREFPESGQSLHLAEVFYVFTSDIIPIFYSYRLNVSLICKNFLSSNRPGDATSFSLVFKKVLSSKMGRIEF